MVKPDQVVFESDFNEASAVDKAVWKQKQGTRWEIADGVMQGQPSPTEYQASRPDHKGLEPRVSLNSMPQDFVLKATVKYLEGEPDAVTPFVEFGHHVVRIHFSEEGARLLVDGESVLVDQAPDFKPASGSPIEMLVEIKGEEFVAQILNGPTLYAKHAKIAGQKDGFGVAGTKLGKVELDDVTVWSIQVSEADGWGAKRKVLADFEPIAIEKKKPAKK